MEGMWYKVSRWLTYNDLRNVRRKPMRAIRDEIEELCSYGVSEVVVVDDPFGVNKRAFAVWSIVDELDSFSKWFCRLRPDVVLGNELVAYLEGRHCVCEIDVLTGSERLLEEHASWDMEEADEVIYQLRRILPTTLHVTIGLPGETVGSLRETRAWLRMIGLPAKITTFVPYPGTTEYEEIDKYAMFGFEITGYNCLDFSMNDRSPIDRIPWQSSVIETEDFITLRNEMVEEFNKE